MMDFEPLLQELFAASYVLPSRLQLTVYERTISRVVQVTRCARRES